MNDYRASLLEAINERRRQREIEAARARGKSELGGGLGSLLSLGGDVAGTALKGIESFSRGVEEMPVERVLAIPALRKIAKGDIKGALWFDASKEEHLAPNLKLGTPKQLATRGIRSATTAAEDRANDIPVAGGVAGKATRITGRGLEGAAGLLLDPTNLLGIGVARKATAGAQAAGKAGKLLTLLTEVAGRGSLSQKQYLAMLASAGAGSGVGGEVAGTPGSILGAFGGGWAGISRLDSLRRARETEMILKNRQKPIAYAEDIDDGVVRSNVRYPKYMTQDGERTVVDQRGLSEQIAAREAAMSNPNIDDAVKESMKDQTEALRHLLNYMRESGSPSLLVDDIYDFGRTVRAAREGDAVAVQRYATMVQAQERWRALEEGSAGFGELRFTKGKEGTLSDLVGKPTDEQLQAYERVRQLLEQEKLSKESAGAYKKAVKDAQAARKAAQEEILKNLPSGARSAGRRYLSALITNNDVKGAYDNLVRRAKGADLSGLTEEVARYIDLHRAVGEAESGLKSYMASDAELSRLAMEERNRFQALVNEPFARTVKEMQGKLIQIPGRPGRYRVKSFGWKDGKPGVDVEYVAPSKSVEEAIGEGVESVAAQQQAVRDARERVQVLRREQARLRKEGADVGDIAERIKIAEQEARDLELVRPVNGQRPEGTRFIPLDDATRFTVWEPGQKPTARALRDAGIKDVRTVKLLNKRAIAEARRESLISQIQQLEEARSSLGLDERDIALARSGLDPSLPEDVIRRAKQLDEIDINLEGLRGQLAVEDAEVLRIDQVISNNQQVLEATLAAAKEEADQAAQLYTEAITQRAESWDRLRESVGASSLQAQERFLRQSEEISNWVLSDLQQHVSGKRLTQGAFNQLMDEYQSLARSYTAALPKPAQAALGELSNLAEQQIFEMGARNAIRLLNTPKSAAYSRIDPDAWRKGVGGWLRRTVMGTGYKNERVEALAAAHFNGEASAAQMADIAYGGLERVATRLTDQMLAKIADGSHTLASKRQIKAGFDKAEEAAWARSVKEIKDPNARMEAVLRRAARPINEWGSHLEGIPDAAKQQIYDLLSGSFLFAARNQELFLNLDPSLRNILGSYRKQLQSIEQLAGSRGLVRNLLKEEFRHYAPQGRIILPDGRILALKPSQRTDITDLYEILRNAETDPTRQARTAINGAETVPTLSEMLIPANEWGLTQASNVLNKINENSTWDTVKTWLKDPDAVNLLRRGQKIQPAEWKSPEYAEDWEKLSGVLLNKPTFGAFDKAARAMNRVAASVITGDGSFSTVQGLIGMAMNPSSTAKMFSQYYRHAVSDEGWMTLMADPVFRNKLIDRVNRGMGIGRASVTGVEPTANIFQSIPGLRRAGNFMAKMDRIAFDRMQTINKMNLIDTLEADVQMIRAFGPAASKEFIDGIPSLERLNREANLFQSTPEEISNAIIRQANNALGGLSRAQSLTGRDRQAIESALLFVPGFFRARGGLINSVSKMLRNPNSPEGYLATSLLMREALFRTAFAASIAEITGTSDKFKEEMDSWAALDPRKPGGMITGPLGQSGGYLGLSWGNQAPKLYAQIIAGNRAGEFNLSLADRLASIENFFEGRSNPVLGGIIDQIRGHDFLGRPVQSPRDRAVAALQMVSPIFVGNTVRELNEDSYTGNINPLSLGAQSAMEFMGLNPRMPLPSERLDAAFQNWQRNRFPDAEPISWKSAPSMLKRIAREENPEIVKLEEEYTSDLGRRVGSSTAAREAIFSSWDEMNNAYDAEISRASARLMSGQITPEEFRQTYSTIQEDRADTSLAMKNALAKAGATPRDEVESLGGNQTELFRLMAEYNAIKPERLSRDIVTEAGIIPDNDIDWNGYKAKQQEVLSRYSPRTVAQFKELQTPDDPAVQQLQRAREVMETYFDRMPKYIGLSNAEGKLLDAYKSILSATAAQYRDMGINVNPAIVYRQALANLERQGQIQNKRQAEIAALAYRASLDSRFAASIRNMEAIQFLLNNQDAILWYPFMESEIPIRYRSLLGPQNVDTNKILAREMRGTSLGAIR